LELVKFFKIFSKGFKKICSADGNRNIEFSHLFQVLTGVIGKSKNPGNLEKI